MTARAKNSRERILECAEALILQKGFTATSIDEILEHAAITKGGFFYHFDGKNGLARALIERYLEQDDEIFLGLMKQADSLSEDPLHRLLIFLKLMAEMMGELEGAHPGCLVASFTYENQQFDEEIRELMKSGILAWRELISFRLKQVSELYPVETDVSIETLADMFTASIEGGIILSRALNDKQLLVDQILAYRAYLRVLFGAQ